MIGKIIVYLLLTLSFILLKYSLIRTDIFGSVDMATVFLLELFLESSSLEDDDSNTCFRFLDLGPGLKALVLSLILIFPIFPRFSFGNFCNAGELQRYTL